MSRKGGKTPTIRTKNMWFTILSKARHDFTVLLQLNNTERTNKREKKRKKERKLSNPKILSKFICKLYLVTMRGCLRTLLIESCKFLLTTSAS